MFVNWSKMSGKRKSLPIDSVLNASSHEYNYTDSFQCALGDANHKLTSTDVGKAFFSAAPQWVENLFLLRNKLVSALGLKVSGTAADRKRPIDDFKASH